MGALSEWLLPRGVRVELNRDEYVQPGPYERAQTDQILTGSSTPPPGSRRRRVAEIRERNGSPTPPPTSRKES